MSQPNSSLATPSHSPLTPTEEQPQRRRSQRLMQRQKEKILITASGGKSPFNGKKGSPEKAITASGGSGGKSPFNGKKGSPEKAITASGGSG
ncbi:hypothetical protein A2U01_0038177, partial [Trifolium medium]|nr:hypothetical protein [Trifolium medium]